MQNTKDDTIVFRPVAGYTINRAIAESIDLATKKNKSVELDINDIVLDITAQSELLKSKICIYGY